MTLSDSLVTFIAVLLAALSLFEAVTLSGPLRSWRPAQWVGGRFGPWGVRSLFFTVSILMITVIVSIVRR